METINQEVSTYIQKLPDWQQEICGNLRKMAHQSIPNVEERLQYGKPHYLKDGSYAAVIHAAKDKVSFMLFNAEKIEPIKGFLRTMGKGERKTVDIFEEQEVDYNMLSNLLRQTLN